MVSAQALEPGGVFAGECGGYGNCAGVRDAVADVIGHEVEAELCPWTFPAPEAFADVLAASGFDVEGMEHFERPVACDAAEWLQQFGTAYIPNDGRDAFLDEFRASAKRRLPSATTDQGGQGVWIDYVRLRWRATKA